MCTVIVADTAGLPEHAGSRGGSSLNCEAHSKACEIKRADDSGFIFKTDIFNSECRLSKNYSKMFYLSSV